MPRLFVHPTDPVAPAAYPVARVDAPGRALLCPQDSGWEAAAVVEWGHDRYRTRFRALWSDEALWVRFDCADDTPWWTLGRHDDPLWQEEVVEVFVDPDGQGRDYAEVEVNPANVVCDLRVRTPWPALDSDPGWNWPGLESRVDRSLAPGGHLDWTACVGLPFAGVATLSPEAARRVPPAPGDRWRFNVFRIKRPHGAAAPERDVVYAAWAVPPGPSFHDPAVFRDLVFGG